MSTTPSTENEEAISVRKNKSKARFKLRSDRGIYL